MNPDDSTGPRWRRRPDDRPSEILDAALDQFAECGLARARVEDIAARAGVSKGTVYLYFVGKEDLFRETMREKLAVLLEGLGSATQPGDPLERLRKFVDAYWEHLRKPTFASLYRLFMAELPQFPELARFYGEELSGKVIDLAAEILRQGIDEGVFREVDPQAAARILVGVLVQHAVWMSNPELFPHVGKRSDAELVNEIKDFALTALIAPGTKVSGGVA